MAGRILEIAADGRHLSKDRGFLVVQEGSVEIGRAPLDDLVAVIASAHGLTFSKNLLVALAERKIPFVFCGPNHMPVGYLQPVNAHHEQAGRMADQAAATAPTRKRLWAEIVRSKIEHQGAALKAVGASADGFALLARKVRSGDPDNVEAQAARRYWPLMFGSDFRRDKDGSGANALLNYGYAMLRSGAARAIMAAGLHPSFPLAHINRGNAFGLVDDVMEPFRPEIDLLVRSLVDQGSTEVTPDAKRLLAGVLTTDMATARGETPVFVCMERLALSLARCLAKEIQNLELPLTRTPLEFAQNAAAASNPT